jgi:hypothetical protein
MQFKWALFFVILVLCCLIVALPSPNPAHHPGESDKALIVVDVSHVEEKIKLDKDVNGTSLNLAFMLSLMRSGCAFQKFPDKLTHCDQSHAFSNAANTKSQMCSSTHANAFANGTVSRPAVRRQVET